MGLVKPLFGFGVGLIGAGLFWRLFDDVIVNFIRPYHIGGKYWLLSDLEWHMIPVVVLLTGIICLIASAVGSRGGGKVVMQE